MMYRSSAGCKNLKGKTFSLMHSPSYSIPSLYSFFPSPLPPQLRVSLLLPLIRAGSGDYSLGRGRVWLTKCTWCILMVKDTFHNVHFCMNFCLKFCNCKLSDIS